MIIGLAFKRAQRPRFPSHRKRAPRWSGDHPANESAAGCSSGAQQFPHGIGQIATFLTAIASCFFRHAELLGPISNLVILVALGGHGSNWASSSSSMLPWCIWRLNFLSDRATPTAALAPTSKDLTHVDVSCSKQRSGSTVKGAQLYPSPTHEIIMRIRLTQVGLARSPIPSGTGSGGARKRQPPSRGDGGCHPGRHNGKDG